MNNNSQIILADKPCGMTSHDVVDYYRKKLGIKKVGHAGTLDPFATGLLIILAGNAAKQQSNFMKLDKEYEATVTFGQERDSYDSQGEIIAECPIDKLGQLSEEKVKKELVGFTGLIKQTVPAYSAVKFKGKKLYEYARAGQSDELVLPTRKVTITRIDLLEFCPLIEGSLPWAKLRIACSSGTYIRSLAHDLGNKLDVYGYISQLRRTKIGGYSVDQSEEVKAA